MVAVVASDVSSAARSIPRGGRLALPAIASLGAGTVHAAAIGAHNEHDQAVLVFALVAAVQLGLGAAALVARHRVVAVALAVANLACVAGWALAKTRGISFVDGLGAAERMQWADGVAAALAAVAVIGVCVAALRRELLPGADVVGRIVALPVAVLVVAGAVSAASHGHADAAHAHDDSAFADGHHADNAVAGSEATARPYVPGEPIDLGGVPGVSTEQQARAENLFAATLYQLPQFADPAVAKARGWTWMGDPVDRHYLNPSTFNDGKILDPSAPESLVYELIGGKETLVAAMFMLPDGTTLSEVPDVGGTLTQWHVHDNLCFTADWLLGPLREPGGPCLDGSFPALEQPMLHVWIVPHPCGPFASLRGIAGGTIAEGETRLCDTAHGHSE